MDKSLVFHEVMNRLYLEDILNVRQVCRLWKFSAEIYLLRAKSITITGLFYPINNLAKSTYKFPKIPYDQSLFISHRQIHKCLIPIILPNITDFSIYLKTETKNNLLHIEKMFEKLPNIQRIIVDFFCQKEDITKLVKLFNHLGRLETLVMLNSLYRMDLNLFRFEEEPFLWRIKHLQVFSPDWLDRTGFLPNLQTLGVQLISRNFFKRFFYRNLQEFIILFGILRTGENLPIDFLRGLSSVNKGKLRSLKLFIDFYDDSMVCFYKLHSRFFSKFFLSTEISILHGNI